MRQPITIVFALVLPALLSAGCKKKTPNAAEPLPAGPEVRLQITSISPSTVPPMKDGVAATVYGSAFESGATVSLSGPASASGSDVQVLSANSLSVRLPALALGAWDVTVRNPDGTSAVLRGGLTVRDSTDDCRNVTVHFDFDSSSLNGGAKSTLDTQMSCFQQSTAPIQVDGHCDERGTTDYNLALGQRRADTVRKYLVNGGVAAGRVRTTSYGEEKPLDAGHSEAAWAKNRRAELAVE